MSKYKVPMGWVECPTKCDSVIMGKFVAFKTPLGPIYDKKIPEDKKLHPSTVYNLFKEQNINIGLWIDLTDTYRYYNRDEVEQFCKYVKISCQGYDKPPSKNRLRFFFNVVDKYFDSGGTENVAVHCTHGFNRTGYLIVCYLVERTNYSLQFVLEKFAEARPPGIYKETYFKELYKRYNRIANIPCIPELPKWSKFYQEDKIPQAKSEESEEKTQEKAKKSEGQCQEDSKKSEGKSPEESKESKGEPQKGSKKSGEKSQEESKESKGKSQEESKDSKKPQKVSKESKEMSHEGRNKDS